MRAWLLVVAVIIATPRVASASCGCAVKLAPASRVMPLRGSVFLGDAHLLDEGEISIQWIGTPGTASWTTLAGDVARLDYTGPDGSELVVTTFKRYEAARYKLSSAWRAPSAAPRAIEIEHHESSWTCASTDALFINVDQSTSAIRIRWTHAGKTSTWVEVTDGAVGLGHVSCCGENIPPDELHAGGELELVAIRVDGSEVPVRDIPSFISGEVYPADTLDKLARPSIAATSPDESAVPQWARFLISLGLICAVAFVARTISSRMS
jgi:hypothetical protein